jgi:hypothetical protein
MESINEYDALLVIINDIIINKNINIQTDNINQIKLCDSSKIPYNTSNEYIITNLINLIEYSNQINLSEFQVSLLIDKLNELLILINNNNEKQIIEQNTYQLLYQFIQYLYSIKQYGINSNIQLPAPVDFNYYPVNENQSQLQLIFDPNKHENETQINMKNENVNQYKNENKNKCCSTCFQCICILIIFTISFVIAVGLLAFGSWSYYQFHDK